MDLRFTKKHELLQQVESIALFHLFRYDPSGKIVQPPLNNRKSRAVIPKGGIERFDLRQPLLLDFIMINHWVSGTEKPIRGE